MNELRLLVGSRTFRAHPGHAIDVSIAIHAGSEQLRVFGAAPATTQPLAVGSFIGDVSQGGSCNCQSLHFTPHCHGTHTESVAHLTREPWPVAQLAQGIYLAKLITVTPEQQQITRDMIAAAMGDGFPLQALLVRTRPNDQGKVTRNYDSGPAPACFTAEAMEFLAQHDIDHLLTDLPSVDPLQDGGRLRAHRAFWGLRPGSQQLADAARRQATITELIHVPDAVSDGLYLLNLNVAPLASDAAPSRPLLYPLIKS